MLKKEIKGQIYAGLQGTYICYIYRTLSANYLSCMRVPGQNVKKYQSGTS